MFVSSSVARVAPIVAAVACAALVPAGSATAATTEQYLYHVTYPSEYNWDGGGVMPPAEKIDQGHFGGYFDRSVPEADALVPGYVAPTEGVCGTEEISSNPVIRIADDFCSDVEHLRGGVVQKNMTKEGDPIPVRVLPGDLLRLVHPQKKTSLFELTVEAPTPVISSVIGSQDVTIGRRADSTSVAVTLQRRTPRNVIRYAAVPGTYQWVSGAPGSGEALCTSYVWQPTERRYEKVVDVAPPVPVSPPWYGEVWVLDRLTDCGSKKIAVPGAPWEVVSYGRLVATADGSYTARFDVPMQAGDVVRYAETRDVFAGDLETTITRTNVAFVGTVPPPDTIAPKITRFDLGAANTSIKTFLKFGLSTFVTLDEPGTVTQQLVLPAPAPKKKKGKKKPAPKPPTVLASGTAKTNAPGETAKVQLTSTKDGRKALRKLKKGKPAKATLITTVIDGSGNTFTSQAALKLSGK